MPDSSTIGYRATARLEKRFVEHIAAINLYYWSFSSPLFFDINFISVRLNIFFHRSISARFVRFTRLGMKMQMSPIWKFFVKIIGKLKFSESYSPVESVYLDPNQNFQNFFYLKLNA